jgi:Tfp pilus assembly protein PilF
MYQEQGERQKAKKELRKTIRLNPKLALPRVFLSAILETESESREAQRELDTAISLGPA